VGAGPRRPFSREGSTDKHHSQPSGVDGNQGTSRAKGPEERVSNLEKISERNKLKEKNYRKRKSSRGGKEVSRKEVEKTNHRVSGTKKTLRTPQKAGTRNEQNEPRRGD